jgi:hypothetical protein
VPREPSHARNGSGDDPRDEGCRMRAGDKDRTQFPPGGEIAHAIGHMAPSRSTNAAAPICLRGSPRSRCSRRPVRQIFAKSRRSTPALAFFAPEEPKDLPAAADITPAEIASNPRAPNVVRVLIADLGERPPAPSSSPPTIVFGALCTRGLPDRGGSDHQQYGRPEHAQVSDRSPTSTTRAAQSAAGRARRGPMGRA